MSRRLVVGCLLAALVITLPWASGCSSKVTKDNFGKVTDGMTLAQVEAILGKGQVQTSVAGAVGGLGGSTAVYMWKDGNKSITVTFVNDKMTLKVANGL